jgi:hypothetical protein
MRRITLIFVPFQKRAKDRGRGDGALLKCAHDEKQGNSAEYRAGDPESTSLSPRPKAL